MCGIVGSLWLPGTVNAEKARTIVRTMASSIIHRGPDAGGEWVDGESGIALGHRRLSILDLSEAGSQPMISASGRYVVTFNGEIYNHLELRRELDDAGQPANWRGHSDTETLLSLIDAGGVKDALLRLVGMFAFAVWDRRERCLWLARDRMGEKPLYYGWQNEVFVFASELKSIATHPNFERKVDRGALSLLLQHNFIPAPYSIWKGISKLPPGTCLCVSEGCKDGEPVTYWSLSDVAETGEADQLSGSIDENIDALDAVLRQAISGQMLSDVPLGALLSGGIDSSTIVALMQAQSVRPVKTFSIGFQDARFDESVHAKAVANHLGTDHTELFMSPADVLDIVPQIPTIYDEPFADSSQLPTALVMSLARQNVTVALSGDGGDELFSGYNRYLILPKLWNKIRLLPPSLRRRIGRSMHSMSIARLNGLLGPVGRLMKQEHIGEKVHKLGYRMAHLEDIDDFFVSFLTEWTEQDAAVRDAPFLPTILSDPKAWPSLTGPVARMMAVDALFYLPDDILVKVDRAAMASSLETRAPFLDHRVVEFASRVSMDRKISNGEGKFLLRQLLYRYVPKNLVDRPKMGFAIPLDDWLRGPLRDWAEPMLAPARLEAEGFFNATLISDAWKRHLAGQQSIGYRLWSILMFQSWLEGQ